MAKPQKNVITNPHILKDQHDIAMQMKGTPIKYPEPTLVQRLKKWLRYQKENVLILCGSLVAIVAVICLVSSLLVAFIISLFIGFIIGIILIDMFF